MEPSNASMFEAALSQTLSTIADSSSAAVASAVTRADDVAQVQAPSSWLGLIARFILYILHILSTILYWSLKLTTISVPTLLFTLFSTSWTVTMNATTL